MPTALACYIIRSGLPFSLFPLLQDAHAGWHTCAGWLCGGPWGNHAWGTSPPSPCRRPSRASCCTWTDQRPWCCCCCCRCHSFVWLSSATSFAFGLLLIPLLSFPVAYAHSSTSTWLLFFNIDHFTFMFKLLLPCIFGKHCYCHSRHFKHCLSKHLLDTKGSTLVKKLNSTSSECGLGKRQIASFRMNSLLAVNIWTTLPQHFFGSHQGYVETNNRSAMQIIWYDWTPYQRLRFLLCLCIPFTFEPPTGSVYLIL